MTVGLLMALSLRFTRVTWVVVEALALSRTQHARQNSRKCQAPSWMDCGTRSTQKKGTRLALRAKENHPKVVVVSD